jgi:hypothetical protein
VNSNRGTVFSVRSVPRCYNQDSQLVRASSVEYLVGEARRELVGK